VIATLRGLCCALVLLAAPVCSQTATLSGKLITTGSDTLGALTSIWGEMLMRAHPDVQVQVRAIGSGAAPTALSEGTADIGPMSRPMSASERAVFIERYGYAPTAVPVAEDAIAVFVHRDNPMESISISELDAVFSITRRCGFPTAISVWGGLGLLGDWARRPIVAYGRSAASGTYSVFREQVLCRGDFSPRLNRLVGSSAVVRAVAMDRVAIGYASGGYVNANVKRLRVIDGESAQENRLARTLLLYVNRAPGSALQPAVRAFLNAALGEAGQREVARAGYLPLSRSRLQRLREDLGVGDG
jgi:phosphate transport system substrate-binding protein